MLSLIIILVNAGFGVAFLMASPRGRTALVLLSFCFNAVGRLDVGVTLDLTKICALLGWGLLIFRVIRPSDFLGRRLIHYFVPFLYFAAIGCTIGYLLVPPGEAATGWARSSEGKPIVQFVSTFSMFSLVPIIGAGLKTTEDIRWFFRKWVMVGILATAIGFVQVGWHQVTGNTLWGIKRSVELTYTDAMINIAGRTFQRANGFVGEPKIMGMLLVISLVVLIASYSYNLQLWSGKRILLYSVVLLLGIFLTFSSGAWLALLLFLSALFFVSTPTSRQNRTVIAICIVIGILIGGTFWQQLYEARLAKIPRFVMSVANPEVYASKFRWGRDKERPALQYLLHHPYAGITGVGLGCCAFYYEPLVDRDVRGAYQEPNSGLTWAIYSFGIVGIGLVALAIYILMARIPSESVFRGVIKLMLLGITIYFLPLNPLPYVLIVIGLMASRGIVDTCPEYAVSALCACD